MFLWLARLVWFHALPTVTVFERWLIYDAFKLTSGRACISFFFFFSLTSDPMGLPKPRSLVVYMFLS